MTKKWGKWYADWSDETGARRRKAFTTRREAIAFQESARKKARAGRQSLKSAR